MMACVVACVGTTLGQSITPANSRQIGTAAGPEDMVIDTSTGSPRLIISCGDFAQAAHPQSRASAQIYYYDFATGVSKPFEVGEVDSIRRFFPHGISKHPTRSELYVIAHTEEEKKNYVIVYSIEETRLIPLRVISSTRFLSSPNDLSVTRDGSFYLTNSGSYKWWSLIPRFFGFSLSKVVYFDGNEHKFTVAGKRFWSANGVHATDDAVFVSDAFKARVKRYVAGEDHALGKARKSKIGFGGDNFSESDGVLYLAKHDKGIKLKKPIKDPTYRLPFRIFEVDAHTGVAKEWKSHNGEQITCVSIAIVHNGYLYLGQMYNSYILEVKL